MLRSGCFDIQTSRMSKAVTRVQSAPNGLAAYFTHVPSCDVISVQTAIRSFFCWQLLGLIPGGTPFSQLKKGVKDATVVSTVFVILRDHTKPPSFRSHVIILCLQNHLSYIVL